MTAHLKLNYTVASDRGLVRGNNEDSAYAGPHLLALADGMGGHAAGEVASQIMITHLEKLDADPGDNDVLALLAAVADDANAAIAEEITRRPETQGMGTTLTALAFDGHEFGLCHVGDSRGYRLRDGELTQITIDDTYVQSLVAEGRLNPEDVSTHPQRSLILKAYTGRPVEPTLTTLDARVGDRILLCSDGLSDPVTHSTIEDTLGQGSPDDAAARLIELALRSGGPDNVTVVVAEVVDEDSLSDAARAALPTVPATAGALQGEQAEATHPDTAAGRAAALRQARAAGAGAAGAAGAGPAGPGPAGAHPQADADAASAAAAASRGSSRRSGLRWGALITTLVLAIAAIGGGWWVFSTANHTYFLATDDHHDLVVHHGLNYTVFGHDLHSPYQVACLSKDAAIQMADVNHANCHPFSINDLPESVRDSAESMPAASYDEVTSQLRRLADQALPVCVTRTGETPEEHAKDAAKNAPTDPAKEAKDAAKDAADSQRAKPGVNCREVK